MIRDFFIRMLRRLLWSIIIICIFLAFVAGFLYWLRASGHWTQGWDATMRTIRNDLHQGIKGIGKLIGEGLALMVGGWLAITFLDELLNGPQGGYYNQQRPYGRYDRNNRYDRFPDDPRYR